MIGNTLLFVVAFFGLTYVPGRLLTSLLLPDRRPEETLPLSFGLGIVLVHTPVFLLAGLANFWWRAYLGPTAVYAISATITLGLALVWLRRSGWRPRLRPARPSRALVALWLLTAASFAFYLLHYDEDQLVQDSCIVRAATGVIEEYLQPDLLARITRDGKLDAHFLEAIPQPQQDYYHFLTFNQGQRSGPTLLVAPLLAVFGVFGLRLVYALQGLLLPGLGLLAGRALFRRPWAAWATALLLTFNPYSTATQLYNENFMALCFSSLALVLLLRARPAPFLAGMALSVFLGVRHVGVVALPALLGYLWWRRRDTPHALWRGLGGLVLFSLPYLIKHGYQLIHMGALFEGAFEHRPTPHSFLGLPFTLKVMLNFPFLDEPMRSPYTAFPTLVAFPLDLARRFGLVLAAMVPAGLLHHFRRERASAWMLVLSFAPLLALLMVQSNWTEPEKMGVPASLLLPVVVTLVAGMVHLADPDVPWRRRLILVGLGLALPLGFHGAVRGYEAPLDPRTYELPESYHIRYPDPEPTRIHEEVAAYVERDRATLRPGLTPQLQLGQYHPRVVALRLAQLADILRHPAIEDYEQTLSDYVDTLLAPTWATVKPLSLVRVMRRGAPEGGALYPVRAFTPPAEGEVFREVDLRLDQDPMLADEPLLPREGPAAQEPLRLDGSRAYVIWGVRGGWRDEPLMIFLGRDWAGTIQVYSEPVIEGSMQAPPWLPLVRVDGSRYRDGRVPLSVPEGAVIRYRHRPTTDQERRYLRYAVVGEAGAWSSAAFPMR